MEGPFWNVVFGEEHLLQRGGQQSAVVRVLLPNQNLCRVILLRNVGIA
jgi:hypothetical protein